MCSETERTEGELKPTEPNWIQTNLTMKRRDQTGGLIESCTCLNLGYAIEGDIQSPQLDRFTILNRDHPYVEVLMNC